MLSIFSMSRFREVRVLVGGHMVSLGKGRDDRGWFSKVVDTGLPVQLAKDWWIITEAAMNPKKTVRIQRSLASCLVVEI